MSQEFQEPVRQPAVSQPPAAQKGKNPQSKRFFLVVLIVAVLLVWWFQRNNIAGLDKWPENLPDALVQAKTNHSKVLVFFYKSPMGEIDRKMVNNALITSRTTPVLEKLGYQKVRLDISKNEDTAKKYNVKETPTVLLLDSDGKVLKRLESLKNDFEFCAEFLGVSNINTLPAKP